MFDIRYCDRTGCGDPSIKMIFPDIFQICPGAYVGTKCYGDNPADA